MLRVTTWCPDTCDCVIQYAGDDAEDENVRVHRIKDVVRRCPAHQLTPQAVFDTVLDENRCKNRVFAMAQEMVKELTPDNCLWFYDPTRCLNVALTGLDIAQKAQLQGNCNAALGANKVKVI